MPYPAWQTSSTGRPRKPAAKRRTCSAAPEASDCAGPVLLIPTIHGPCLDIYCCNSLLSCNRTPNLIRVRVGPDLNPWEVRICQWWGYQRCSSDGSWGSPGSTRTLVSSWVLRLSIRFRNWVQLHCIERCWRRLVFVKVISCDGGRNRTRGSRSRGRGADW